MAHLGPPRVVVALLALSGCEENFFAGQDAEKMPCPAGALETSYEAVEGFEDDFDIEPIDCGLAFPTRIKISPDGALMLVAQLRGQTVAYTREADGPWTLQQQVFYDLGELDVPNEAGLTAITFGVGFDLESDDPADRDVFLNHQFRADGGDKLNRITRVTATLVDGAVRGTDPVDIFTSVDTTGDAHQIQEGISFLYQDEPHLLVALGDANKASSAQDVTQWTRGTILLMDRDGEAPDGPRPWPDYPLVEAIGVRNIYGMTMFPESVDPQRGILGVENGNSTRDRMFYYRMVDFEGDNTKQVNLGWNGDDGGDAWENVPDVNTAGALGGGRNSVFELIEPTTSPTSVALHPGKGFIRPSDDSGASFLVVYFGKTGETGNAPGKNIQLYRLENILGAALQGDGQPIIERKDVHDGSLASHPVAMDVDPVTGDILFADILTGELNLVNVYGELGGAGGADAGGDDAGDDTGD